MMISIISLAPIHSVAASASMFFSVKRPIFPFANTFSLRGVRVQRAIVFGSQLQIFIAREALPGLCSKGECRKASATVDV